MFSENIFELFLWFVIYSFIGWLWEEIICSIDAKKLLNRGFMSGPYCPIYGFGAMLYLALMHITTDPLHLFLLGGIAACTLEYITSYLMEKLFKARWWDYSDKIGNINGRVCLLGFCCFATFAAIFPFVHQYIAAFTDHLPNLVIIIVASLIALGMLSDLTATIKSMLHLNEALASYEKAIKRQENVRFLHRSRKSYEMRIKERDEKHKVLGYQQRHMLNSFPHLNSKYAQALERFRKMSLENAMVVKDTKKDSKSIKKQSKKQ